MLVIGLTGGIGSGKSVVADLFAQRGIPIIDADLIAREIVTPGEPAYQAIIEHHGPDILQSDHTINRKRLREIIFEDEQERKWLEKLLHPIIIKKIEQRIPLLQAPYCIVVIPLLIESPPFPFIDRVLVVDASIEQQTKRLSQRDQIPAELIASMLQSQVSREERLAKADDVIMNDGSLSDLEPQIEKLDRIYRSP